MLRCVFYIFLCDPNFFSSAFFLAGPIPGFDPAGKQISAFFRRFRWAVIANRWASSRMRCIRKSPCESAWQFHGDIFSGRIDQFMFFGQPDRVDAICSDQIFPALSRPCLAGLFRHPRPARSGKTPKDGSIFFPNFSSSWADFQRLNRRESTSSMLAKSSGPMNGFYIEAPVKLFTGSPLFKHNHTANGGCALCV